MAVSNRARLAVVLALTACGGGSDGGSSMGIDANDALLPDANYGAAWTVSWGEVEVPAQTEETRCVTKRLGNTEAIRIGQIHNVLGVGSHHLIVYRVGDGEESAEPTPCQPFQDVLKPDSGQPLAITQVKDETITLPPGVA